MTTASQELQAKRRQRQEQCGGRLGPAGSVTADGGEGTDTLISGGRFPNGFEHTAFEVVRGRPDA